MEENVKNNYTPLSKNPFKLDVVVPQTMAFETQRALDRLRAFYGDIDLFVSRRLGYRNRQEMYRAFSAEQIDALAMALHNIEKGEGMIIGDMTGIGKGRIAAGIIRYSVVNDLPCVFVSEKSSLFSDMYRDLIDIGYPQACAFILNDDTDAQISVDIEQAVSDDDRKSKRKQKGEAAPSDSEANMEQKTELVQVKVGAYQFEGELAVFNKPQFKRIDAKAKKTILQTQLMEAMQQDLVELPKGYDFVMTTYSQFQYDNDAKFVAMSVKAGNRKFMFVPSANDQTKTEFLKKYIKGGVVIMDEAHNAGGDSTQGYLTQMLLNKCKGACYLSATFAKTPANMPLYAVKTVIKNTNLSRETLKLAFKKGGVALQEIVASDLVREGQMLRRQRTYDNIPFHEDYLIEAYPQHKEIFDKVTTIVRQIIAFQSDYIKGFVKQTNDALKESDGGGIKETQGKAAGTMEITGVFNTMHHLTQTLLFSLKAREVADKAIELLRQNKKVVIAFAHTCETYLEELGLVTGEVIESDGDKPADDFAVVIEKMLKSVMVCQVSDGKGKKVKQPIPFEQLPYLAQLEYNKIVENIRDAVIGISLSPIDVLINRIEAAQRHPDFYTLKATKQKDGSFKFDKNTNRPSENYVVRECTGRSHRIANIDGLPTYIAIRNKKKQFFSEFNNGTADVLLINQSSSTGVSCHSSEKFDDVRKRCMIIHECELDINIQVQKLGRIYRSGMIGTIEKLNDNLPEYFYLSSSIPAEKRMFMILKKKLKSLDANTTGSQRNSEDTLQTEDFFNKYGAGIIRDYLTIDERGLYDLLGGKTLFKDPFDTSDDEDDKPSRYGNDDEEESDGRSDTASEKICWKTTNRIAIMPVETQEKFYEDVARRYGDKIETLKQEGEYDLETEFFDFKAVTKHKYLFVQGKGGTTSFDRDAIRETCEVVVLKKAKGWSEVQSDIKTALKGSTPEVQNKVALRQLEIKLKSILDGSVAADKNNLNMARTNAAAAAKQLMDVVVDLGFVEKIKDNFFQAAETFCAENFILTDLAEFDIVKKWQTSLVSEAKKDAFIAQMKIRFPDDKDFKEGKINLNVLSEEVIRFQKAKQKIANVQEKLKNMKEAREQETEKVRELYRFYQVGQPIAIRTEVPIETEDGQAKGFDVVFEYGIVTKVDAKPTSSNYYGLYNDCKVTIAVASGRREMVYGIPMLETKFKVSETTKSQTNLQEKIDNWNNLILSTTEDKTTVNIVTGNPILAISQGERLEGVTARLIKFSTAKGSIKAGVLLKLGKDAKLRASVPIDAVDVLKSKVPLKVDDDDVTFITIYGGVRMTIPRIYTAKDGKFDNAEITDLITRSRQEEYYGEKGSFKQLGGKGEMFADFATDKVPQLLKILAKQPYNYTMSIAANSIEIKNEQGYAGDDDDDFVPNETINLAAEFKVFWYVLPSKYSAGIYPSENYVEVLDEVDGLNFGIIGYSEPLSISRKAGNGLVNYWESEKLCLEDWYDKCKNKDDFKEKTQVLEGYETKEAAEALGRWMYQHSPEDGNAELYFGNIDVPELGMAALQRFKVKTVAVGQKTANRILKQLKIALATLGQRQVSN